MHLAQTGSPQQGWRPNGQDARFAGGFHEAVRAPRPAEKRAISPKQSPGLEDIEQVFCLTMRNSPSTTKQK